MNSIQDLSLVDLSSLPLEVLVHMALQMDIPEVLSFCQLSKRINRKVCRRKHFWRLLLAKDNLDIPSELIYKDGKFNWLLYFLIKYPGKYWDWFGVSKNSNITWEIIQAYPNLPWNWLGVSMNPNITLEIISKNPDSPWEWGWLHRNPNITLNFIQDNLDKNWEWTDLSEDPILTWDFISNHLDNPNIIRNWSGLSVSVGVSLSS